MALFPWSKSDHKSGRFFGDFFGRQKRAQSSAFNGPGQGRINIYTTNKIIDFPTLPRPVRPGRFGGVSGSGNPKFATFSTSKSAQTLTTFSTRKSALFRPRNCSSLDVKLGSVRGRKSRLWEARNRRSRERSKRAARAPRVLVPGWGKPGYPGPGKPRFPGTREVGKPRFPDPPVRPVRPPPKR